jgi:hypothetical protein
MQKISVFNLCKKLQNREIEQFSKILIPKKSIWDVFILLYLFGIYSYYTPLTDERGSYYRVDKDDFYVYGYKPRNYVSTYISYEKTEIIFRPEILLFKKELKTFKYRVFLSKKDKQIIDKLMRGIYKVGFNNIIRLIKESFKNETGLHMFNIEIWKFLLNKNLDKCGIFLLFHYIKNMRYNHLKDYYPEFLSKIEITEDVAKYNTELKKIDEKYRNIF